MKIEERGMAMESEGSAIRELGVVRQEIDRIDAALVLLIRDRIQLALAAADSKTAHGQALRDVSREVDVVRRAAEHARALGVDAEPVRGVFWRLIELSHGAVAAGRGR